MALMRRGLSEDEAYRRVQHEIEQKRRVAAEEVAAARAQASAFGATPFEGSSTGSKDGGGAAVPKARGFAETLLRRFAEEAREGNQPYPAHWFNADGSWRGIGDPKTELSTRTVRAINRVGRSSGLEPVTCRNDEDAQAAAAQAEAESMAAAEAGVGEDEAEDLRDPKA